MGTLVDITGEVFGRLTAVRREGTYVSPKGSKSATWLCRCECGNEVMIRGKDLRDGKTKSCGCLHLERATRLGAANSKGDEVEYLAAHARVRRARGRAATHPCADCGVQAGEWSYIGGCPRERISATAAHAGVAYSPDPARYVARCVSCHRKHDLREEAA